MLIPLILTQIEKLIAWRRRVKVLHDLAANPAMIEDLGIDLLELDVAMREADEQRITGRVPRPAAQARHEESGRYAPSRPGHARF